VKNGRVFVVMLGIVAISAIAAAVVAGELGNSNTVSGLIAIAATAVGSLATIAHTTVEIPVIRRDSWRPDPIPPISPPIPPPTPPPPPPPTPDGEGEEETQINWPQREG